MMSTQVYELHVFEGLRPMRERDRCWPHWPWPAEGSEYEELCRAVLAEQMRQETPRAVLLLSAPARRAFHMDEGTTKYDVQLPAFDENGGLQRIRHDEPTMFLARNHPASMRFVKKFWDWVRDARDYVRSRLG